MKEKFIVCTCFLIISVYFFYIFYPLFQGPDQPIYYAYTESVVEDGDLNPINNIHYFLDYYFPNQTKNVSQTFNLPDYHGHGGVTIWAPFYICGKYLHDLAQQLHLTIADKYPTKFFIELLMTFSTVMCGILTLLLTYMLCNIFFSRIDSLISTIAICFGSPFFYYILFEPGNAQILITLLSVFSILSASFIIQNKKSHWFIYGLFFGMCLVVKADIWAQIFFIIFLFAILLKLRQTTFSNGLFFTLGLLPASLLKLTNDYLKYGTFHIGEAGVLNAKMSYLHDMFFSSYRGYVYTSPILVICIASIILVSITFLKNIGTINNNIERNDSSWRDIFIAILSFYLIIKILIISHNYDWGGGTTGCRALLTEFPVFVLLYARIFSVQKKPFKFFIFIISLFFIIWNMLVISEYMLDVDLSYVSNMPALYTRANNIKTILSKLTHIQALDLKLYLLSIPLIILLNIIFGLIVSSKNFLSSFWHLRKNFSKKRYLILCIAAIYLTFSYSIITVFNVLNNKKNVEKLKKNNFFNTVKILSPKDFEKSHNIACLKKMIKYYSVTGNVKKLEKIKGYLNKMQRDSDL